jgi:hypothetical protein
LNHSLDEVNRLLRLKVHPLILIGRLQAPDSPDRVDGPRVGFLIDDVAVRVTRIDHLSAHLDAFQLGDRYIALLGQWRVGIRLPGLVLDVVQDLIKRLGQRAFAAVVHLVVVVPSNLVLKILLSKNLPLLNFEWVFCGADRVKGGPRGMRPGAAHP